MRYDQVLLLIKYDEKHPLGSGIGFTEEEEPNFEGSFYSYTKKMAEKVYSFQEFNLVASEDLLKPPVTACPNAHL